MYTVNKENGIYTCDTDVVTLGGANGGSRYCSRIEPKMSYTA